MLYPGIRKQGLESSNFPIRFTSSSTGSLFIFWELIHRMWTCVLHEEKNLKTTAFSLLQNSKRTIKKSISKGAGRGLQNDFKMTGSNQGKTSDQPNAEIKESMISLQL